MRGAILPADKDRTPIVTDAHLPIRVVALYRFTALSDCPAIRDALVRTCRSGGVKGTLLLAKEGINGTIAGTDRGIDRVLDHIRTLPGCTDLDIRESRAATMPFHRMKVRLKREIVTMGQPDIDPSIDTGHYVAPQDWNALIDRPDTIVIDTRNDYEVAIGSFAGAIDPGTRSFRDFPQWFREQRAALTDRRSALTVAMFCTGGIRCEKATAFLKAEGIDAVHHLKGGILSYLETVAPEDSRWRGECFVFDERVSVTHGLSRGSYTLCRACRMPVGAAEQASSFYIPGVSCPACHATRTDRQRQGYAERVRQSQLAASRGETHVGAVFRKEDDDDR